MDAKKIEHLKLKHCEKELRALLKKLIEGNYGLTAEQVYDLIANTGVETSINPALRNSKTMEEFLKEE